ncbi:hypothetical protein K438DRAFT_731250 [Mycena galopus ATCC 62051]|nr:hypothetical protein K438DRAFT_731250 [Mycena galopus ATCC 62051]
MSEQFQLGGLKQLLLSEDDRENVVCDSRDPSGGGGFADVYKGRIGNNLNPVALKVLRIHVASAVLAKVEKVISHILPSTTTAENSGCPWRRSRREHPYQCPRRALSRFRIDHFSRLACRHDVVQYK